MNATLIKFGYPGTLIRSYRHWCVLLRPVQATLGALILGARGEERSFSRLPPEAFAELALITSEIERGLASFRPYDRINYLMLMMNDPHVHFHVLPRYAEVQDFQGQSFPDSGWPAMPDLKSPADVSEDMRQDILRDLQTHWPAG